MKLPEVGEIWIDKEFDSKVKIIHVGTLMVNFQGVLFKPDGGTIKHGLHFNDFFKHYQIDKSNKVQEDIADLLK